MNGRTLAQSVVDGIWVSTVRLTVDHGFGGEELWYETMLFPTSEPDDSPDGGKGVTDWTELYCDRYTTAEQALAGHDAVVARLKSGDRAFLTGSGR